MINMIETFPAPLDEPRHAIMRIGPREAEKLLQGNTHNRNLRERNVEAWAHNMRKGKWVQNGETLKFAYDGTVLDGQHRLKAIIKADLTLPFLVVYGLPLFAQDTVDGGPKRTFTDVLKIKGYANYAALATTTRAAFVWNAGERNLSSPGIVPTTPELLDLLLAEQDLLEDSATVAMRVRAHRPLQPMVGGLSYYLFSKLDQVDTEYFFARYQDGANLAKNHPINVLIRTVDQRTLTRHMTTPPTTYLAFVVKAWNAYREGRTLNHLSFRSGGAKPEPFPEPR